MSAETPDADTDALAGTAAEFYPGDKFVMMLVQRVRNAAARLDALHAENQRLTESIEGWKRMYDGEFKAGDKLGDEFVALERKYGTLCAERDALQTARDACESQFQQKVAELTASEVEWDALRDACTALADELQAAHDSWFNDDRRSFGHASTLMTQFELRLRGLSEAGERRE